MKKNCIVRFATEAFYVLESVSLKVTIVPQDDIIPIHVMRLVGK